MESTPRTPISARSRQAVLERRRAARDATPPRASKRASQEENPSTDKPVGAAKLSAGVGEASAGLSPATSVEGTVSRIPPALPPSTRKAKTATTSNADAKPTASALVAPLPELLDVPQPVLAVASSNTEPAQLADTATASDTAPAQPADTAAPSDTVPVQTADAGDAKRSSTRIRTPTMYRSDDEDHADENSALLGESSLRSDLEHNTKIINKLLDDVNRLKVRDSEIERMQDELAQIDDEVDDACETLATLISLTFLAPTFSRKHKIISLFMTFVVWIMQALLTYKLYGNAKINDGGQVMLDLGSGYMEMNSTMASAECDGCCDETIHSTDCRLAMMDAFENAIFERKAGQCDGCEFSEKDTDPSTIGNRRQSGERWSSEIYDMHLPWSPEPNEGGISLCFTERGLANGWVNLFAGMMIIIITLIREIQESLGGIYVVKQLKYDVVDHRGNKTGKRAVSLAAVASYVWVTVIVLFHCFIGVYLLYASFRRMINAPNDIWAVVESSISAFLVVSIDDAVMYVVLLHPKTKKAVDPLGQKSADPSKDKTLAERRERLDSKGREYPPYPNNPGPPRILMHNKAPEGEDPEWHETDCVMWHPTEHIMTAGGYLMLYNYMIEWLYLHFFFWFVGGRLAKFSEFGCADAKEKNAFWADISFVIGKIGPLSIVAIGLVLDVMSIARHAADRHRRMVRCFLFYIAAFLLAEMFSSPAWLVPEDTESEGRRFWETSPMLWTYRIVCILIIGAIIPSLSRKRWNKWFVKQRKSFACTVHVGGLSEYTDEARREEYQQELAQKFAAFGKVLTTEVRIRDQIEDGQRKVSWALVSFLSEDSAQKAVAESNSLERPDWVVKLVDADMALKSEGMMTGIAAKQHDDFHEIHRVTSARPRFPFDDDDSTETATKPSAEPAAEP